ncbi:hypothetical protein ABRY18_05670 [Clostridioides difficile]
MSIKVKVWAKLPYIIKLEEEKDYEFSFLFDDFDLFKLNMRFNDENDFLIYNNEYPGNVCQHIELEVIYKYVDYTKYKTTKCISSDDNYFVVEVPLDKTTEIFGCMNKRLNEILNFLREKSNMFWIDEFNLTHINYHSENEVRFNFYSPNVNLSSVINSFIECTDYYMISKNFKTNNVGEDTFKNFDSNKIKMNVFNEYIDKAEKALYEYNYENFIMYCGISVESFIKQHTYKLANKDDIVYNRLKKQSSYYIDLYYNVLLKYLTGKSLEEIDRKSYKCLVRLYSLRNSLMHEGIIDKRALEKADIIKLDFSECYEILDSAKTSFKLVKSITVKPKNDIN